MTDPEFGEEWNPMTNKPTAPDLRKLISQHVESAIHGAMNGDWDVARDDATLSILVLLPAPIPQGEDGFLDELERLIATYPTAPWSVYQHPNAPYPDIYDVVGKTRDHDVIENLDERAATLFAALPRLIAIARAAGGKQ